MLKYYSNKTYVGSRNVIDDVPAYFNDTIFAKIQSGEYELGTEELSILVEKEGIEKISPTGEISNRYGSFTLLDIQDMTKILLCCVYLKNNNLDDVLVLDIPNDYNELLDWLDKYETPFIMKVVRYLVPYCKLGEKKPPKDYTVSINDKAVIKGSNLDYVLEPMDLYKGDNEAISTYFTADDNIFDFKITRNVYSVKANNYVKKVIERAINSVRPDNVITMETFLDEYNTALDGFEKNESNITRFMKELKGKVIVNFNHGFDELNVEGLDMCNFRRYLDASGVALITFEPCNIQFYYGYTLYVGEEIYKKTSTGVFKYKFSFYEDIDYNASVENFRLKLDDTDE